MNDDLMNFDDVELISNPSPRLPISVVLDCSDSMETVFPGENRSALEALNGALDTLVAAIHSDPLSRSRVEVSFVPYGTQIAEPTPFTTIDNIVLPDLQPMGITNTGAALKVALDSIEERKKHYKTAGLQYFQGILLIISDGLSMDSLDEVSQRIQDLTAKRKLSFFAVGVAGADKEQLTKIGNKKALMLKGMKFDDLFLWLSQSAASVSASNPESTESVPVERPSDDWASI